ncbi:sigma-70 RNA polymerase sigma factor region 4 domain-containing protein [Kineosporia succinea]|uniref:DNA-directed RNA polymerase specialized sigma24 family protein n=1 Tax=Kineosporia succinea TaxID=84632 RepID=A0ABT9P1S2_9ACTN|nr:hypothetical protein [Kineosporia succinea]MDP9826627.1 DNA-directed RNA polymerase specialized sigma24 family protein [Kineosporia succinea]
MTTTESTRTAGRAGSTGSAGAGGGSSAGGRRRPEAFAGLFPELYRAAWSAAYSELGSRPAAREVTLGALARAHARWRRIGGDSPVVWASMTARTQALEMLQRRPDGSRDVLLDEELEELGDPTGPGAPGGPGDLRAAGPLPGDLAAVTRRGLWLRRRRLAGWVVAAVCVVAAALLAIGLGNSMPPSSREPTPVAVPARATTTSTIDLSPIGSAPWTDPGLAFGRISAGRSEQGSVRLTFEPHVYDPDSRPRIGDGPTDPARQLVFRPDAALTLNDSGVTAPEELVQTLNRSTPGGQTYAWIRLGPDGKISALREE